MDIEPVELDGRWEFVLEDSVNRCYFDYQFTIQLLETKATIVIGAPFNLTRTDDSWSLDPEDSETMCPALSLVRKKVSNIVIDENGALRMHFDQGYRLTVEPDPHYEAWNLSTPTGWKFVVMPGGELAIWKPNGGQEIGNRP